MIFLLNLINIVSVICGIVGTILNIYRNKYAFIIWNISNIALIILAIVRKDYINVVLWVFYFVINLIGFYKWNKIKEK